MSSSTCSIRFTRETWEEVRENRPVSGIGTYVVKQLNLSLPLGVVLQYYYTAFSDPSGTDFVAVCYSLAVGAYSPRGEEYALDLWPMMKGWL
jgi:hypothetical protein